MTALRVLRVFLALPALAISVAVLGFVWFLHLAHAPSRPPPVADGIVVLTGGADRVATALRLLAAGQARILLVSGAGAGTGFSDLVHHAGADPALGARVTLGHGAASTHGNAIETARWAEAHGVRSLIVVTAFYHMPRAIAELSRALPGAEFFPVAVWPERLGSWQEWRLMVSEYLKWLAVEVGVSADSSRPGPARLGPALEAGGGRAPRG